MEELKATAAIEATMHAAARAVERGDVDGVLAMFQDDADADVVIMDYTGPCRIDLAQLRANFTALASNTVGSPVCRYVEIHVTSLAPGAAFSWAVMQYVAQMRDGEKIDLQARVTHVWSLIDGKWLAVHEHGSFPVDPKTGQPDMHACSSRRLQPPRIARDPARGAFELLAATVRWDDATWGVSEVAVESLERLD